MRLPIAILAGGLGKRLDKKTTNIPKALLDIYGKPFISRQLNYLKDQGFNKVVICVGHYGEKIKNLVGNGSNYNLNVAYSDDGQQLLGTGGSLKKACKILDKNFFVLYGDSFLPVNFSIIEKAFLNQEKPALMTVLKNSNRWDKSNVYFENENVIYNKKNPEKDMNYIDYGLSVVNNSIFDNFIENENFDIAEIFENLSKNNLLAGYEVNERFYEIGSSSGLNDTIKFFKKIEKQ
jgi:NDP-sugar pyrophosphorylase family protein|tara:strand:+ start:558 stop:1262 length:705 start_codon:yes stop_codon:yes gene_type:complete